MTPEREKEIRKNHYCGMGDCNICELLADIDELRKLCEVRSQDYDSLYNDYLKIKKTKIGLNDLAERMIKNAKRANATKHHIRWQKLSYQPGWDLKVEVSKRRRKKKNADS